MAKYNIHLDNFTRYSTLDEETNDVFSLYIQRLLELIYQQIVPECTTCSKEGFTCLELTCQNPTPLFAYFAQNVDSGHFSHEVIAPGVVKLCAIPYKEAVAYIQYSETRLTFVIA